MSVDLLLRPLVSWPLIVAVAAIAAMLLAILAVRGARGWLLRLLALFILLAAVLNPIILSETRVAQPDVAAVVLDVSPSQQVGDRSEAGERALEMLKQQIGALGGVELRVVESGEETNSISNSHRGGGGSRLFEALDRALSDGARDRLAAAILITDGQVHDVPDAAEGEIPSAPVHAILTGEPGEQDRRLVVDDAPAYLLVGTTARLSFHVDDGIAGTPARSPRQVTVRIRVDGEDAGRVRVAAGERRDIAFALRHAGPTVVELEAEPLAGELSPVNNRAAVTINGVRDRLRVLLVSGQPHPGERLWRNMLKSDPAVDLVHFTILRPPDKEDLASIDELSLIAFPVRELFEEKLEDFDLVIFDRYRLRGVLPFRYLSAVSAYVRSGGALLLAVGPEFAGPDSLFRTPLGDVMPAAPAGGVFESEFRPAVTGIGRRHPVTSSLPGEAAMGAADSGGGIDAEPMWGRWYRMAGTDVRSGKVLMSGHEGKPLLAVDRVGDGRVAQLLSDHLWLWSRGYDGGGPNAELVRRLVHWLMKEPELEEEALSAVIGGGRLSVERRSLEPGPAVVTVVSPDGTVQEAIVEPGEDGIGRAEIEASQPGLYRIEDGSLTALAAGGRTDPLEFADLRATAARLRPVAEATGGGVFWAAQGVPDVRRIAPGGKAAGESWIGLQRMQRYQVTGVRETPLLPGLLVLAAALLTLAGAWWREGR